jgi:hypothetical protein
MADHSEKTPLLAGSRLPADGDSKAAKKGGYLFVDEEPEPVKRERSTSESQAAVDHPEDFGRKRTKSSPPLPNTETGDVKLSTVSSTHLFPSCRGPGPPQAEVLKGALLELTGFHRPAQNFELFLNVRFHPPLLVGLPHPSPPFHFH